MAKLWETVGMAKRDRELVILHDPKLRGVCKACAHQFTGTEAEILQKFNAHQCNEDASQAAARIAREATENR